LFTPLFCAQKLGLDRLFAGLSFAEAEVFLEKEKKSIDFTDKQEYNILLHETIFC